MKTKRRLLILGGIAAVGALSLSGCGPSPSAQDASSGGTDVYAEFDGMPDGERQDALVAAAEEEGEVTAYLRADDVFQEIEDAFEAEYDIDLTLVNPGRVSTVRQQVFEQASAGRMEADVVEVFTSELNLLYGGEGVAAPVPEFLAKSASDPSLVSEFAIETLQYPYVPLWNTAAVTGEDVPTTYEDFLKPFWKERLVLATGNEEWYRGTFQILTGEGGMSVSEFKELFTQIMENTSVVDSNNPASAGVASGEYYGNPAAALVTAQRIAGAPLGWEPPFEQTVVIPAGISLMADAPHPTAAMLFAQWYMGEGGSDILEEEQFVSQNPNEKDLIGADLYRPDDSGMTAAQLDEWRTAYDNLTKGKGDILPAYVEE